MVLPSEREPGRKDHAIRLAIDQTGNCQADGLEISGFPQSFSEICDRTDQILRLVRRITAGNGLARLGNDNSSHSCHGDFDTCKVFLGIAGHSGHLSHEVVRAGQGFRGPSYARVDGLSNYSLCVKNPLARSRNRPSKETAAPPLQLRTILPPTDSRGCANFAVAYAAAIGRAAKAKIICIYFLDPMVPAVGYTGLADPM